jgi:NAD(P)-dependent dehydrogenase (short-subunit alcohol dehydrogenase family)
MTPKPTYIRDDDRVAVGSSARRRSSRAATGAGDVTAQDFAERAVAEFVAAAKRERVDVLLNNAAARRAMPSSAARMRRR